MNTLKPKQWNKRNDGMVLRSFTELRERLIKPLPWERPSVVDNRTVELVDELVKALIVKEVEPQPEEVPMKVYSAMIDGVQVYYNPADARVPLRAPARQLMKESMLEFVEREGQVPFDRLGPSYNAERTVVEELIKEGKLVGLVVPKFRLMPVVGPKKPEDFHRVVTLA
jgi:hypothetical protein